MSLMEELYGKVYRKTWKGKDFIIYRYGKLRPKDFGEILFSEEWNYLIYTLYYLHTIKHLIPPRVKFPQITRYIISITPTLAFAVYAIFKIPTEFTTRFSDIVLPWISYSYRVGFIEVSNALATLERSIRLVGAPITLVGGEYRLELAIEIETNLLGDAPYRESRIAVAPTGDLRLWMTYRPGFIYYYRYSFADISRSLLTIGTEHKTEKINISTFAVSITVRSE